MDLTSVFSICAFFVFCVLREVWVPLESPKACGLWRIHSASVRPGGTVNFFGGCPPGTIIPLDAYQIHYNELTIKSTYHHRPDTIKTALNLLADPSLNVDLLLSSERPIEGVEEALRSMMNKESLKVVIKKRLGSH